MLLSKKILTLILIAPAIALGQSYDDRLAVRVSVRQKYLTLKEFAKLVHIKASVPAIVDHALEDRKVSVFCDDSPLSDVMERVASTLCMEWARDDTGGYRLRLQKGVLKEEDDIASHEAELAAAAVRRQLMKRADLAQSTVEDLQDEFDKLNKLRPILAKDQSDEGKAKYKEVDDRFQYLWTFSYNHQEWDDGYVVKQMTPDQMDALMSGQTIFASTQPRPGMLVLPASALTRAGSNPFDQNGKPPTELILYMRYNADSKNLEINHRVMGSFGRGGGVEGLNDPTVLTELSKEPLIKRLNDWAKSLDPSVLSTRLTRDAEPPTAGPYRVYTMADNLQWLHDKTGLPIVADAFHCFASFDKVEPAPDVASWLDVFNQELKQNSYWPPARVRTEKGWLMMRHRRYWRMLPTELPQSAIEPLEDKYSRKDPLTLNDYAAFAASLTPAQATALGSQAVNVPLNPVFGNVEILSLWNSLPQTQQEAAAKNGVFLGQMSSESRQLYQKTFAETLWTGFLDVSILPYYFPGGPPLPNGMGLFYEDTDMGLQLGGPDNFAWVRYGGNTYRPIPYAGARMKIGLSADSKVMYEFQIRPLAKS